jgi:hypothetical protein
MINSAEPLISLAGLWLGLLFSLAIFSTIIGNHVVARVAQYVLVGASLGYVAVVALREVLQPRLFAPLLQEGAVASWLWLLLLLSLLLLLAGGDHALTQNGVLEPPASRGRKALRAIGVLPAGLMVGVGVSVAVIGVLQGTLAPQLWQVVQTELAAAPLGALLTNWMTVLLATASLLYWSVNAAQDLAQQPQWLQRLLRAWIWVGKRAFWFTAGVIFARLAAARLSLLIARFEYFLETLKTTGVWNFVGQIWSNLTQ